MADEGVHEIQLNGKQLVFLFMSATVVAVVIFLCGVMVGRGVNRPALELAADDTLDPTAIDRELVDPTLPPPTTSSIGPAASDRLPVTTQEELTYAQRLEAPVPPPETLKEPSREPVVPVAITPEPAARTARATPPPAGEKRGEARGTSEGRDNKVIPEPPGNGYVVQVGAYPRRTADVIAQGLAAKGFPTFIAPRDNNLFAVRVGKYTERREAEAMRLRLERDEKFKTTWITR